MRPLNVLIALGASLATLLAAAGEPTVTPAPRATAATAPTPSSSCATR